MSSNVQFHIIHHHAVYNIQSQGMMGLLSWASVCWIKMAIVLPKGSDITVAAGYMKSPLQEAMLHAAMTRLVNNTDNYHALANLVVII